MLSSSGARRPDVEHEEQPAGPQRLVHPGQHACGVHLVVDGVEGGDNVERRIDGQPETSHDLERRVRQPPALRLGPGLGDRVVGEVVADEGRARERPGHQVDRVPGAAPDVRHAGPQRRAGPDAGGERQDPVDQLAIEQTSGRLVHDVGELRPERRVRHPAALAHRPGDAGHVPGQQGVEPAEWRQVGEPGPLRHSGVLGRQRVAARRRVVLDDACGDSAPSHSRTYRSVAPARSASSALVPGPAARVSSSPVRCPRSIIRVDHAVGVGAEEPLGERLHPGLVDRARRLDRGGLGRSCALGGHRVLLPSDRTREDARSAVDAPHRQDRPFASHGAGWFYPLPPCRWPHAAAAVREPTPSLVKMFDR